MAPSFTLRKIEFGVRLKAARDAAHMSQARAAAAVGTSRRHWIRWEKGETSPNPAYLARIASVLDDPTLAASEDDDEEAASMAITRGEVQMLGGQIQMIGDLMARLGGTLVSR